MSTRIASVKRPVPVVLLLALLCSLCLMLPACNSTGDDSPASQESASQTEAHKGRLTVFLDVDGWDATQGSIPVTVSGTTHEGDEVDEVIQVVPGKPNVLPYEPGSYTFSCASSTLSGDVVYADCSVTVEFEGTEDKTAQLVLEQDAEATEQRVEEGRLRAEEEAKAEAEAAAQAEAEAEAKRLAEEQAAAEAEAAAQAEAQRRAEEEARAQANSQTVYITNTGAKYHENGCRYLKKSKIPISLSDAKAQGYEPCKVCH